MANIYYVLTAFGLLIGIGSFIKKSKGAVPLTLFWLSIAATCVVMYRSNLGLLSPDGVFAYAFAFASLGIVLLAIWYISVYIGMRSEKKSFMTTWLLILLVLLIATIISLINILTRAEAWRVMDYKTIVYYVSSIALLASTDILGGYFLFLKVRKDSQKANETR